MLVAAVYNCCNDLAQQAVHSMTHVRHVVLHYVAHDIMWY